MTIEEMLHAREPAHEALAGERQTLTYGELARLVDQTRKTLRAQGIGAGDTVATVLRNGLEAAAAFLSLSASCRVAPINPAYRTAEMAAAFDDLGPAAIIVTPDAGEALAAAKQCRIPVLALDKFELLGSTARPACVGIEQPGPDHIALLLHTSGTTSQPKLVPLTHRNLALSARNVARTLELTEKDRCLSVMPLFHIHGLVAGLLASLSAGASVYCAPAFQATSFFGWLQTSGATWYTAVPTMHQAILARAPRNRAILAQHRLRLIRSCSSPLDITVRKALEATFETPVVSAYGMTEAAHQIASQRAGDATSPVSVGRSTGPEIAILNASGTLAAASETGEVVLRGKQVMTGYLSPSGANDSAFRQGWFRTGDQGILDASGQLTLVGRLKEMINSGGEKISPYEVEEALLQHPGVAQVVAFAMPHRMLGEAVAAAVVLRDGCDVSERDLLETGSERLSNHKLPRHFVFLGEIPQGATGKPQRIGLAARLGLT